MEIAAITQYVVETFPDVHADTTTPDTFFLFDPERKFPFATIVTRDNDFDSVSKLDRPGVFRLNVGLGPETFRALFGASTTHDFTALDRLMPHPLYGRMHWICVLNPSEATFERLKPLLAEAYALSVRTHGRKRPADAS